MFLLFFYNVFIFEFDYSTQQLPVFIQTERRFPPLRGLLIGRVSVCPAESYSDKSFSRWGYTVQKLELPVCHCRWKNHNLKYCIYCATEVSGNLRLISRETWLMRALECLKQTQGPTLLKESLRLQTQSLQ